MSEPCICLTAPLTKYFIGFVEDPDSYVNHAFIRRTGVIVDIYERMDAVTSRHKLDHCEILRAFTIAEIFRLIDERMGDTIRTPRHRITNDDGGIIVECKSITAQATLAEMKARRNARLFGK